MKLPERIEKSLLLAAVGALAGILGGVILAPVKKGVSFSFKSDFSKNGKPASAYITVKTGKASNKNKKLKELENTMNKGMVQQ